MKKENLKIQILVENKSESKNEEKQSKWIKIPTSDEIIRNIINSFASIEDKNSYVYKKCESNCGIFIWSDDDILEFNRKISFLDELTAPDEVQALIECFDFELTDVIKIVKQGNYEFFPNKTLDDILSEEELYNVDIADEEDLINKGYSQTSTGVIKIINNKGEI